MYKVFDMNVNSMIKKKPKTNSCFFLIYSYFFPLLQNMERVQIGGKNLKIYIRVGHQKKQKQKTMHHRVKSKNHLLVFKNPAPRPPHPPSESTRW